MKTIKTFLLLATVIFITSCEGPQGPPGDPGTNILGTVFEIQGDFTADNDYLLYYQFPSNFVVYDSDVVLVYMLWEKTNGLDVWRLMPQTKAFKTTSNVGSETDVVQYNFDYTNYDVQIFMESTLDLSTLLPEWTDNQKFRIVVLPADFVAQKSVDINDMNSVLNAPQLRINSIEYVNPVIK